MIWRELVQVVQHIVILIADSGTTTIKFLIAESSACLTMETTWPILQSQPTSPFPLPNPATAIVLQQE